MCRTAVHANTQTHTCTVACVSHFRSVFFMLPACGRENTMCVHRRKSFLCVCKKNMCVFVPAVGVYIHYVYTGVHRADILRNNIAYERRINCQRLTLLMLLFLSLWQLCRTLQGSRSNTKNNHLSCLSLAVWLPQECDEPPFLALLKTFRLLQSWYCYLMLIWLHSVKVM